MEIQAQFSTNIDPRHKHLHDWLDMQTQAGAKIEKLEGANFVTPEDMQKQIEGLRTCRAGDRAEYPRADHPAGGQDRASFSRGPPHEDRKQASIRLTTKGAAA